MEQLKVTQAQLDDLLELNALDQSIATTKSQLNQLAANPDFAQLQQELSQASSAFLEASKVVEVVSLELERNNADLLVVEQRIARDQSRLNEAKNSKDVAGLQNELDTLAKRKSQLEDSSIELMEKLVVAEQNSAEASSAREHVRATGQKLSEKLQAEANKLRSGLELATANRSKILGMVSAELQSVFERKKSRGVPIGRLAGPQCGACHMTLSSTQYQELLSHPLDELLECPDCSAILVRS